MGESLKSSRFVGNAVSRGDKARCSSPPRFQRWLWFANLISSVMAKDPMSYIASYRITERKLAQQFIDPGIMSVSYQGYESWLRERARRLAEIGNAFLVELSPPA
jgi:hypothetical protein